MIRIISKLREKGFKESLTSVYESYLLVFLNRWLLGTLVMFKYWLIQFFSRTPVLLAVAISRYKTKNSNWGDDVSIILTKLLSGRPVIPYRHSYSSSTNIASIGSIIQTYTGEKSIIWGSGIISKEIIVDKKPKKVLAVRGPLTREVLLSQGINCPEIYGDPALLFPALYNPPISPKYKYGIIGHHSEVSSATFKKYVHRFGNDALFIDITKYGKWTDFIDKIKLCKAIISSSLHGIIMADAYGVPNLWAQFEFIVQDGGFKFHDYFLSVGKKNQEVFVFNESTDISFIDDLILDYKRPIIDLHPLLDSCPFLFNSKAITYPDKLVFS